jgi:hypothetical protein
MTILELRERQDLSTDPKLQAAYAQMTALVSEMKKKTLTPAVISSVNAKIDEVNTSALGGKELTRLVKNNQRTIIRILEKEMKIVPKNYYRTLWTVLGMSAFGIPLGVAFGTAMKNMGMLGLGLPIGLAIGLALGTRLDKKAADEGRQMDFEAKL